MQKPTLPKSAALVDEAVPLAERIEAGELRHRIAVIGDLRGDHSCRLEGLRRVDHLNFECLFHSFAPVSGPDSVEATWRGIAFLAERLQPAGASELWIGHLPQAELTTDSANELLRGDWDVVVGDYFFDHPEEIPAVRMYAGGGPRLLRQTRLKLAGPARIVMPRIRFRRPQGPYLWGNGGFAVALSRADRHAEIEGTVAETCLSAVEIEKMFAAGVLPLLSLPGRESVILTDGRG